MNIHATSSFLLNPNHPIKVCLIGAGGTGSLTLSRLARMDFALKQSGLLGLDITTFDDDKVEHNNIGRQGFGMQDIGEYKSVVLTSKINRNFNTNHTAKPYRFNCNVPHEKYNIYITAVDTVDFRIEFDAYFKSKTPLNYDKPHQHAYYWMDYGNSKNSGQCILGSHFIEQKKATNTAVLPTVLDRFKNMKTMETKEIQGNGCSYASKLNEQNLFINDNLSSLGSHLIWELLTEGYITNCGFFMNLKTLKSNPILV